MQRKYEVILDEGDDIDDLKVVISAGSYYDAIFEFKEWLRNQIKYSNHNEEQITLLENVRDNFIEILSDNDCFLE